MTKKILKILAVFTILNLIPLLWKDKVVFNIETFTTEYYKFLYNIFIVGLLALFFKNQTEGINKSIDDKQKTKRIKSTIQDFKKSVAEKNLEQIKSCWKTIYSQKETQEYDFEIEKMNRYIQNMTQDNIEERLATNEFSSLLNTIKI